MTLREYLARPGITASALAARCHVATSTITRIAAGQQPSIEYAKRIKTETGGLVNLLGE
jgi:plasmid maintenance system antidote protein VapI